MSQPEILAYISQSLTLVLPIFCAGLILIWSLRKDYFARFNIAVDGGKSIRGKRVLGDNKTWRGIGIYFIGTIAVCIFLWLLKTYFPELVHPVYSINPFLLGAVFSMSYVTGELVNSFVKRRSGISPGSTTGSKTQRIADNIDGISFVVGALFVFMHVAIGYLLVAATMAIVIHKATDLFMVRLGLK